mmetsp:Transcript_13515/g.31774  ORF Transcript_13515/g.31774 Transcript_13515/m.31774 type:complete len:712 (-) Transcript_13515:1015-3150(-)
MTPNVTDHIDDIIKDDNRGRDPNVVDELLTKEMFNLSVRDRNDIQEEIHGVRCLAVKETPDLVKRSLEELTKEIDENIPASQKRAYLRSLEIGRDGRDDSENVSTSAMTPEVSPGSGREQQQAEPPSNSEGGPIPNPKPSSSSSSTTTTKPPSSPSTTERSSSAPSSPQSPASTPPAALASYIHGDDFRLRFLRCDFFDVPKAALRMVTYLDMLVELFGEEALKRPISISDFTKEELRHMRKGMIQILPYRDRSGRRIMICFPEEEESQIPPYVKAKIAMYQLWAIGSHDTVTQEKGIVVLVWFDASFAKLCTTWKIKYKFYTLNCDRIAALHCCSPDTPHYRFRRSIMTMRAGHENLSKLIFHLGESMEIHYKLQGYGIPFEHVPISWTGKVKVQYLKQWMRIRQAIERQHGKSAGGSNDGSSCDESMESAADRNIIECPQLRDVVFRQGTSGVSHPGNVTFRSLIESTVVREQIEREKQILELERERWKRAQQQQQKKTHKKPSKADAAKNKLKAKRPKQLAQDIYEARMRTCTEDGRFLIWNNQKGWWNELTDKEQICMKIEYMVREFQKISQRSSKLMVSKKGGPSRHNSGNSASSQSECSVNTVASARRKDFPFGQSGGRCPAETGLGLARSKNVTYLQSGTSLFQSQDGSIPFFANKRQRLLNNQNIFAGAEDGTGGMVLNFGAPGISKATNNECFGMKFTPCLT